MMLVVVIVIVSVSIAFQFLPQVDTVTLIQDLVSLSKNSPSGASPLHYAQTCSKFPSIVSEMLIDQLGIGQLFVCLFVYVLHLVVRHKRDRQRRRHASPLGCHSLPSGEHRVSGVARGE